YLKNTFLLQRGDSFRSYLGEALFNIIAQVPIQAWIGERRDHPVYCHSLCQLEDPFFKVSFNPPEYRLVSGDALAGVERSVFNTTGQRPAEIFCRVLFLGLAEARTDIDQCAHNRICRVRSVTVSERRSNHRNEIADLLLLLLSYKK